jgi:hypothetical protein
MLRIPLLGRGVVGLAALALLTLSATSERAQALSLINPGAAATAKVAADGLTTEVRGGHGGGHSGGHGGGHGWGGSGGVGSGAAIHSGAFRTGPVFTGGGVRSASFRHGGHRFHHRHHFRGFFAGGYYDDYPYYDYPYYAYPGCRIVVTDYGPRRVCNYRYWRHHHYRRHHHRRHHRVYR